MPLGAWHFPRPRRFVLLASSSTGRARNLTHYPHQVKRNSVFGVEIKGAKKRGGYVRNVHISYSSVCRILMHSVGYNDDGEPAPTAPIFEDCSFENMDVTTVMYGKDEQDKYCDAIEVSGFDVRGHFARNIKFKNIVIDNGKESKIQSIYLQCCEGVSLENVYCR